MQAPVKPIVLQVRLRPLIADYHAFVKERPVLWAVGDTPEDAIAKLKFSAKVYLKNRVIEIQADKRILAGINEPETE